MQNPAQMTRTSLAFALSKSLALTRLAHHSIPLAATNRLLKCVSGKTAGHLNLDQEELRSQRRRAKHTV